MHLHVIESVREPLLQLGFGLGTGRSAEASIELQARISQCVRNPLFRLGLADRRAETLRGDLAKRCDRAAILRYEKDGPWAPQGAGRPDRLETDASDERREIIGLG